MSPVLQRARAFPYVRPQAALAAALLVLATLAWVASERLTGGMASMPGADLGNVTFYTATWVVMMAAMMFPSVAPMVIVYDRLRAGHRARRGDAPGLEGTAAFVAGYLVTWTVAGLAAYAALEAVRAVDAAVLAWERAGREVAAAVILAASAYQLTPIKRACLTRCRGPFSFVLEHWREGRRGALRMGTIHGAWCVGCCWALMAGLFALGLMSVGWMAFIAALITIEKLLPSRLAANWTVAVVLFILGCAIMIAPEAVPGLPREAAAPMGM